MTVLDIRLSNFRSYESSVWRFDREKTVFTGRNGVGKSNLAEAIFFCSILRSFRSSSLRELYRIGKGEFVLEMTLKKGAYPEKLRIVQQLSGGKKLFIDGEAVRRTSDFIREFRAVAFSPEDRNVAGGSSAFRRRFFDMLISVLEPEYLKALQNYTLALRERNAALKNDAPFSPELFGAFERIMAENGVKIGAFRRKYAGMTAEKLRLLSGGNEWNIVYRPGFPEDEKEYAASLASSRERDGRKGFTFSGPQLDDWKLTLNDRELRLYGSSGQLRLCSLYLRMAEFMLVREISRLPVVAVVDDVTGELDAENRARFFELLKQADQCFFTFTAFPEDEFFSDAGELKIG